MKDIDELLRIAEEAEASKPLTMAHYDALMARAEAALGDEPDNMDAEFLIQYLPGGPSAQIVDDGSVGFDDE